MKALLYWMLVEPTGRFWFLYPQSGWRGGLLIGLYLSLALWLYFMPGNVQAGELKVEPLAPAPVQEYRHGFYGGLGISDSEGSGSLQAEQMIDNWKLFAQIWTDNDEDQFVLQQRRTPKQTNVLEVQGGDTSNVALGGAYCVHEQSFRGCLGGAYLTDDDTDTVEDHLAVYWELGAMIPQARLWRAFVAGYGSDEAFIMGGRRF